MKKILSFFTALIMCSSVLSCSSSITTSENETDSNKNKAHSTDSANLDDSSITQYEFTAIDYLDSLLYISDEWKENTYLVYGTNKNDENCYGILHSSGGFQPLTEYAAYYPLADGNLLVTNEPVSANEEFESKFYNSCKIIDESGKILYEPSASSNYQLMHVINPHSIFVLSIISGFDGIDVSWGVLDNKGNWIHKLDDNGSLVDMIEEYELIELESDGTYHITRSEIVDWGTATVKTYSLLTDCYGNYEDIENEYISFRISSSSYTNTVNGVIDNGTETKLLLYSAKKDEFTERSINEKYPVGLQRISEYEWIQFKSSFRWDNAWYTNKYYYLYNKDGCAGEIKNYLTTDNGIKYWFDSTGIIYSDTTPNGLNYPERISNQFMCYKGVEDNLVFIALKGLDKLPYFAVGDTNGNIIKEPFTTENLNLHEDDSFANGNFLIYYDLDSTYSDTHEMLYIVDWKTEEVRSKIMTTTENGIDRIYPLGDNLIVVEFKKSSKMFNNEIYTFKGERIA